MRQVYTIRRINNFTSFEVVDKFDPMFFHGYRQRNNHIGRTQNTLIPHDKHKRKLFITFPVMLIIMVCLICASSVRAFMTPLCRQRTGAFNEQRFLKMVTDSRTLQQQQRSNYTPMTATKVIEQNELQEIPQLGNLRESRAQKSENTMFRDTLFRDSMFSNNKFAWDDVLSYTFDETKKIMSDFVPRQNFAAVNIVPGTTLDNHLSKPLDNNVSVPLGNPARATARAIIYSSLNLHKGDRRFFFAKSGSDQQEAEDLHSSTDRKVSSKTPIIQLTSEERDLFNLLLHVVEEKGLNTTLRVAGGWVRDKLLATEDFNRRFEGAAGTLSTFNKINGRRGSTTTKDGLVNSEIHPWSNHGHTTTTNVVNGENTHDSQPVDIDIALDNMVGRQFANELNDWLSKHGRETVSVGMMMKNPEKSKHLETATMQINDYWIDFVNLRTEEYAGDSRIPDLMRIGTAKEDAFRRDLTINSLFFNINTGQVEDLTGRGLNDLFRGIVSTPLKPLTTLLDDPLRVLRSVRFAARLRFSMDDELREAAKNPRVHEALALKVSRERVGTEVDLMLRSKDPVGAMRLLIKLRLIDTIFPVANVSCEELTQNQADSALSQGLVLLNAAYDHLSDCTNNPPMWFKSMSARTSSCNGSDQRLFVDEEARRLLWYASFLKPLRDAEKCSTRRKVQAGDKPKNRRKGKKCHQSLVMKLMIDDLKRSVREAEEVEKIQIAADEITDLMLSGGAISASTILLSGIRVSYTEVTIGANGVESYTTCTMAIENRSNAQQGIICVVNPETEDNPMWTHAMEFRLRCYNIMSKIGDRWQAAFMLSLAEQLSHVYKDDENYAIEGDIIDQIHRELKDKVIAQYDAFAGVLLELGLIGLWDQKPLLCGEELTHPRVLPNIPKGPAFRQVMDEQAKWMVLHPGGSRRALIGHLRDVFPEYKGN